jgi:hypothetical protein
MSHENQKNRGSFWGWVIFISICLVCVYDDYSKNKQLEETKEALDVIEDNFASLESRIANIESMLNI